LVAGLGDTWQVIERLLAALGGPDFRQQAGQFDQLDERACDVLLAVAAGDHTAQLGGEQSDPRGIWEDLHEVLAMAASRWSQRFTATVAANPKLRRNSMIAYALGFVDSPDSVALLLDAVTIRTAGHALLRRAALKSLIRLAYPALSDVLLTLVRDRDSLTRYTAVNAAIGYGDARLIEPLRTIARADRTELGTRNEAWDAIEAIAHREGLAGTELGPHGRRLIPVPRPPARENLTVLAIRHFYFAVSDGQELAVLAEGSRRFPVIAPCGGEVVSNLLVPGRPAPTILMWIRRDQGSV
jgi:hypothetical protein